MYTACKSQFICHVIPAPINDRRGPYVSHNHFYFTLTDDIFESITLHHLFPVFTVALNTLCERFQSSVCLSGYVITFELKMF